MALSVSFNAAGSLDRFIHPLGFTLPCEGVAEFPEQLGAIPVVSPSTSPKSIHAFSLQDMRTT
jgi:hypothetical protein